MPPATTATRTAATPTAPCTARSQPLGQDLTRPFPTIDRYGELHVPDESLLLVVPDQGAVPAREAVHPDQPDAGLPRQLPRVVEQFAADATARGGPIGHQQPDVQLRLVHGWYVRH